MGIFNSKPGHMSRILTFYGKDQISYEIRSFIIDFAQPSVGVCVPDLRHEGFRMTVFEENDLLWGG